ncbi:MAG TPA: outer membrane beta-barrel protein [Candidatus Sulfotelmatobacter sp.]|nr:outer membrane beta-barrel protein [Candidatus Sulfotelmatobacter sp.]
MRLKNHSLRCQYFFLLLAAVWFSSSGFSLAQQTGTETPLPDTPKPGSVPTKGFFARWAEFYHQDWSGTAASSPAPARRGLPSPLDSPPFPNSDWSYGGSPVIGEPDTNSYPLMTAINGARSRTKLYGWIDPTLNFSTSTHSNAPEANDNYSNRLEMNQLVFYAERLPDSVQRDHIDWGYHLTALYGTDYRFTIAKGYLSSQLLNDHRQYGFDPTLEYLDVYFPNVAQGMNVRLGRFISVPGIEAQLAPNNYIFSHSLLYAIDPFTDTGLIATVKLNDQWLVQLGITDGHDVALWTPDAKPSGTACVSYTTKSVNANLYLCANGINDGKYAYNNLQQYDATWYHKFSKTVHMATEAWYMYERGVPALEGTLQPENGANGAYCLPGEQRCTAPEYAIVNFLQRELSPHNFLSFRTDFLNDKKGQRTGYATRYSENTVTWCHWIGTTVQIRPELRFERAWDNKAYDNGRRQSQLTVASDLIFHF